MSPLFSGRDRNRDLHRRRRDLFRVIVAAPNQYDYKHNNDQQQSPYEGPHNFRSLRCRFVSRELVVTLDEGMLIGVSNQKRCPLLASNCSEL